MYHNETNIKAFPSSSGSGMSLRDYFAAKAMQAMLSSEALAEENFILDLVVEKAYTVADKMIIQRGRR